MTDPITPAFPTESVTNANGQTQWGFDGLTKREEFARSAMVGLLADHKDHEDERRVIHEAVRIDGTCIRNAIYESCPDTVARLAVEHADALIAALNKK